MRRLLLCFLLPGLAFATRRLTLGASRFPLHLLGKELRLSLLLLTMEVEEYVLGTGNWTTSTSMF